MALPRWLRLRRERDFDKEGRDWLYRLCGPPPRPERRLRPGLWPKLRGRIGSGKGVAFAAMGAGLVALFSPSLPSLAPPSLVATSAAAGQIVGHAYVIDGDTIQVSGTRIRLQGMDAPEMSQQCRRGTGSVSVLYSCGREAKAALERIIGGSTVACQPGGQERYGRTLATCVARGADVGREMVRQGWAVAYSRYSLAYVADEGIARAANRALWAGEFENPEQ
jgi:endonuclease YncB( thermonuclease family)